MNGREDDEMVAYALEIDPVLLEFAPELLTDLDVLGANAPAIIEALRLLGVAQHSTVIDLGCGKGGVSIAIAAALGCRVIGVELFEPFIAIAQAAAEISGVGNLCRFVHGDIGKLAGRIEPADAVVYAALGDVLGRLDATMAVIRNYAKSGGYVVINDCYLHDTTAARFPGFENYTDLTETRVWLTACGDELILELFERDLDSDAHDIDEGTLIAGRAADLAARHPHLASKFDAFARSQLDEYDFLAEHTAGAVWAVQRR